MGAPRASVGRCAPALLTWVSARRPTVVCAPSVVFLSRSDFPAGLATRLQRWSGVPPPSAAMGSNRTVNCAVGRSARPGALRSSDSVLLDGPSRTTGVGWWQGGH